MKKNDVAIRLCCIGEIDYKRGKIIKKFGTRELCSTLLKPKIYSLSLNFTMELYTALGKEKDGEGKTTGLKKKR